MRCPKCGYISFDNQESCRKCKKNIGDAVAEVNGTVYDALPPTFLQLEKRFRAQPGPPVQDMDDNREMADSETGIAVREGIDTDFVLGDEEITLTDSGEETVMMNLEDFSEVAPREEFTLDLDEDRGGIEANLPSLDFGDLDISDLAPPEKEHPNIQPIEEELELAVAEPVAALSKNSPPQQKTASALKTKSTGLEDLHLSGLNLDSPPKFVAGSAADKRYSPSVKTGTALDKFDIDLGELFEQNKK